MDLHVRLWGWAEVHWVGFLRAFHCSWYVENMSQVLSETGDHNLIQLCMDGLHMNWKAFELTQKEVQEQVDKSLLNIGSCGLHVMHNMFRDGCKATGCDIEHTLSSLYWLFWDGAARHEDFVTATGCSTVMLRFCRHRILRLSLWRTVARILCSSQKWWSSTHRKIDPPFLTLYQTEKQMLPSLTEELMKGKDSHIICVCSVSVSSPVCLKTGLTFCLLCFIFCLGYFLKLSDQAQKQCVRQFMCIFGFILLMLIVREFSVSALCFYSFY